MPNLSSSRSLSTICSLPSSNGRNVVHATRVLAQALAPTRRTFAQVKDLDSFGREIWFTSSAPQRSLQPPGLDVGEQKPDERTVQLGKTVRELHTRLPTLLQAPLPSEILSPQITLHLFPSTHPHLPTVSGRIAYIAALWTAPVAWGQIPLIGNVQLNILSERMIKGRAASNGGGDEKLVVKWKSCAKGGHRDATGGKYRDAGIGARDPVERIKSFLGAGKSRSSASSDREEEEFCGIFIFEFDANGRIIKHVIEHTEHGEHWDKTNRVVSVTDWLLGKFNGASRGDIPALAYCNVRTPGGLPESPPFRSPQG